MLEHIPEDVDLVLMELDINHHDPHEASLKATEALYRTILEMPQKPAIIYLSIFALMFQDMTHGWRHSALISQWFDVVRLIVPWKPIEYSDCIDSAGNQYPQLLNSANTETS